MKSKWDKLKDLCSEHGVNPYIGEYVKIRHIDVELVANLFDVSELYIINSGRESSSEWEDGWFVLAKSDYEK